MLAVKACFTLAVRVSFMTVVCVCFTSAVSLSFMLAVWSCLRVAEYDSAMKDRLRVQRVGNDELRLSVPKTAKKERVLMNALSSNEINPLGSARASARGVSRCVDRSHVPFRRDRDRAAGGQAVVAGESYPAPGGASEHVAGEAVPERDRGALLVLQLEIRNADVAIAGIFCHDRKSAAAVID